MDRQNERNLSEAQIEQQEKLGELKDLIKTISKKNRSDFTGEFMEFFDYHDLNREDYYLAMLFVAIISNGKLPREEDYEFIDTEDGKIESLIRDLAKFEPSK